MYLVYTSVFTVLESYKISQNKKKKEELNGAAPRKKTPTQVSP
jgi:hypothetical protein